MAFSRYIYSAVSTIKQNFKKWLFWDTLISIHICPNCLTYLSKLPNCLPTLKNVFVPVDFLKEKNGVIRFQTQWPLCLHLFRMHVKICPNSNQKSSQIFFKMISLKTELSCLPNRGAHLSETVHWEDFGAKLQIFVNKEHNLFDSSDPKFDTISLNQVVVQRSPH